VKHEWMKKDGKYGKRGCQNFIYGSVILLKKSKSKERVKGVNHIQLSEYDCYFIYLSL